MEKAVLDPYKSQEKTADELWHHQYGNNKIIVGKNLTFIIRKMK
jgi:hypothetical protein